MSEKPIVLNQRANFSLIQTIFGMPTYGIGIILQGNIYEEVNLLEPIEKSLSNQTSLSSYGAILFAMGGANLLLGIMEEEYKSEGLLLHSKLAHLGQYMVPITLMGLNVLFELYEVFNGDTRIDNHGMDILMGFIVGLQGLGSLAYTDILAFRNRHKAPSFTVSQLKV